MSLSHTTPRITARVDASTQALLAQAAALSGISSINAFVLNAAIEKAKLLMQQEQMLTLHAEDAALLIAALEQPANAIPALQQAAQRYHTRAS